ncbi:MAG: twin-arginine translocase TatA/TatE family subunit [Ignavibacteria bacterium]|jgi:sec-independent protein translocase protein TatA|nr:twin-arginine translocase TatA/TatE family subunit [Ignavibacteria bacterium]
MFDIGGGELILILVAFVVLFGPQKIPDITRTLGKGMRKVKDAQNELKKQFDDIEKDINKNINP